MGQHSATGSIPNEETLKSKGVGENVAPSSNTESLAGGFCALATGVSQPIAAIIQQTVGALNSLQGIVDGIVYAPARGLAYLQQRILSGEILNDVTLKIVYSIGNILKSMAKSLATQVAFNAFSRLASNIGDKISNAFQRVNAGLGTLKNRIVEAGQFITDKLVKAESALVTGVYALANVPLLAVNAVGNALGGEVGDALMEASFNGYLDLTQKFFGAGGIAQSVRLLTTEALSPLRLGRQFVETTQEQAAAANNPNAQQKTQVRPST